MNSSRMMSSSATEAARLLGQQVRAGRLERRWTVGELASRVGVTDVTMRKVERGDPTVALGTAFEAATLVGVALVGDEQTRRAASQRLEDRLALLPARARPARLIDDDF